MGLWTLFFRKNSNFNKNLSLDSCTYRYIHGRCANKIPKLHDLRHNLISCARLHSSGIFIFFLNFRDFSGFRGYFGQFFDFQTIGSIHILFLSFLKHFSIFRQFWSIFIPKFTKCYHPLVNISRVGVRMVPPKITFLWNGRFLRSCYEYIALNACYKSAKITIRMVK